MGKRFQPKFHNSKVCYRCKEKISEGENYATLVSHSGGKIVHQDNWHAKCWTEHVQEWVIKTMSNLSMSAIKAVPGAMEFLKKFRDDNENGTMPVITAP